MVRLHLIGLFGNNLFQYCVGRIIAEELGYKLQIIHSSHCPGKNIPQLMGFFELCQDAPFGLDGNAYSEPIDNSAYMREGGFDGYRLDLDHLLTNTRDRCVLVKGYFERYEIFQSYKQRIRSWFKISPVQYGFRISEQDLVVHLRRGDFTVHGRTISLDYYGNILRQLSYRKLYICGFGVDDEVKTYFSKFSPVYVSGSANDDFRFLMSFDRMILSQSTFSWWASFLSDASLVFAPVTKPNSSEFDRQFPHVDLQICDEERFTYIHNVPYSSKLTSIQDVVLARPNLSRKRFFYELGTAAVNSLIRKNT